jgi:hypothetical protein
MRCLALLIAGVLAAAVAVFGELADTLAPSVDHPAIGYFNYLKHPPHDAVSELDGKIQEGTAQLQFEPGSGYLRPVLEALHIPIESQVAVFSKTSLQSERIAPDNPRTIFFNDSAAVAWVRGGFIELAAQDPEQGVIFHTLEQHATDKPMFQLRDDCLRCHISDASLGVPGMMVRSRYTATDGRPFLILGGFTTDQRSPWSERWGGWYVTGKTGSARHMGNTLYPDEDHSETIPPSFDSRGYLSPYSDVVALLVFNHQMHLMNLLTRVGWDTRAALHDHRRDLVALLRNDAAEIADYMLFINEAPLPPGIQGTAGFQEKFEQLGPRDSQGRSLRQFDLKRRLMRYPCSYMIYTEAFDALPEEARSAVYQRMWEILSGSERGPKYARLSLADRQAIAGILRETKRGLPGYFQPVR